MRTANPDSAPTSQPPESVKRSATGGIVAVVNVALTGIGTVYAATRSLMITLLAAATAVLLVMLMLIFKR